MSSAKSSGSGKSEDLERERKRERKTLLLKQNMKCGLMTMSQTLLWKQ
jgi:hypothetical protein